MLMRILCKHDVGKAIYLKEAAVYGGLLVQYGYVLMNAQSPCVDPFTALIYYTILQQNILIDCIAGKNSDCRSQSRPISKLNNDNCLTVCGLDQFCRGVSRTSQVRKRIVDQKKKAIRFLNMASVFTASYIKICNVLNNIFSDPLLYLFKAENRYREQSLAKENARYDAEEWLAQTARNKGMVL